MSADRRPQPAEGGPAEMPLRERASATPHRAIPPAPAARQTTSHAADVTANVRAASPDERPRGPATLRGTQSWFVNVITAAGLEEWNDQALSAVLTGGPRNDARARMAVYHHAYRARLIACLADDYPALRHALGEDAFERLADAYVAEHPSRSPNLNAYGRHMEEFCRQRGDAFAADLATLEWALVEVLHAAEDAKLDPVALGAVPVERWADARFVPSATTRLLRFAHPVNAFYQAFRAGSAPQVPPAAASATAVYRVGTALWRMDLTPAMAALLEALFAGASLGEALTLVDASAETLEAIAEAERSVMIWFQQWVASGFFATVMVPP